MRAIKFYVSIVFFITLVLQSCNFSDSTENLGNGYFYRNEGETIKDILSNNASGGEIPATVVSYDFDDDFIIAKQKPKLPQDPLYEKDYKYDRGDKEYYFWIIEKNENIVLGPLNLEEFKIQRRKYKVPNELVFK
jgi:adenine/guanine phosphoribosyltransferase-like PRPP-binding protein